MTPAIPNPHSANDRPAEFDPALEAASVVNACAAAIGATNAQPIVAEAMVGGIRRAYDEVLAQQGASLELRRTLMQQPLSDQLGGARERARVELGDARQRLIDAQRNYEVWDQAFRTALRVEAATRPHITPRPAAGSPGGETAIDEAIARFYQREQEHDQP